MKVIDLLNKIANGEIPKKIIYDDKQWTYDEKLEDYITYDDSRIDWKYTIMEYINDEVEIIEDEPRDIEVCGSLFTRSEYNRLAGIEEDKKIEKININGYDEILDTTLANKINEIIDYLEENK